mmetsp:Transcript_64346/g.76169  ORF Transcript_64346/g.76169 Transcript_64346/m.76169 type:complete len:436 (+) Transcript_64346:35-1342(+)|eukprot:CAMPEP_0172524010 /NCGR_PEP_ID=MMETSP1066-20121228/293961_1 /TAXON_ID=671091 /ORGANISM="Coscinodiscus wailesii, Strain CCMP2513" /LENGTH=435 /DNA_ID=CAMNT_0013307111 /DNA_START=32 /DNA_END=1339 /DNA_ORIENTATION=-
MNARFQSSDESNMKESTPIPVTDAFGLPVRMDQARAITSLSDGPLGEVTNARSVPIAAPCFPSDTHEASQKPTLDALGTPKTPFEFATNTAMLPTSTNDSTWILPEGSIKPVPDFYPLELTSTFIEGVDPSVVAGRIAVCLCQREISASFGEMKAKAKCKTKDGVEFRVRLYSGKGDYARGIIVEVQRRSGWTPNFQQDVFAILESAEGIIQNESFELSTLSLFDDSLLEANLELLDEDEEDEVHVSCIRRNLLLDEKYDVQVSGMKMLCSATNPLKVGSSVALANAKDIITDPSEKDVRRVVVDSVLKYENKNDLSDLHDFSLRAIHNCIDVIGRENAKEYCIDRGAHWLVEELFPCLLKEMDVATEDKSSEAAITTKCLVELMSMSPEVRRKAHELGADTTLANAQKRLKKTNNYSSLVMNIMSDSLRFKYSG